MRVRRSNWIWLMIGISLLLIVACQPIEVYMRQVYKADGHVTVAGTDAPLGIVEVVVGNYEYSVLTNFNGDYEMQLPEGTWTLHFQKSGFLSQSVEVTITDLERRQEASVALEPEAVPQRPARLIQYGRDEPDKETTYSYDDQGRMIRASREKVDGSSPPEVREFSYDGGYFEVTVSQDGAVEYEEKIAIDDAGLPISWENTTTGEFTTYEIVDGIVRGITSVSQDDGEYEWEDVAYDKFSRFLGGQGGIGSVIGSNVFITFTVDYEAGLLVFEFEEDGEIFTEEMKLVLTDQGDIKEIWVKDEDIDELILDAVYEYEDAYWDRHWWIMGDTPYLGT